MPKKKNVDWIMQILLTLLGVGFILRGIFLLLLAVAGEQEFALITDIRRQGGRHNGTYPNQYTYIISYCFTLPDGKNVDAFSTKIGNAVYIKANGRSTIPVRYFSFFPELCALEEDTKPGIGQLLYIGVGCFLIKVMNAGKKRHSRKVSSE